MVELNRRRLMAGLLSSPLWLKSVSAIASEAISSRPLAGSEENEYRALICLQLNGGNDSWNLLLPTADEGIGADPGRGYQSYQHLRGELAVQQRPLTAPDNSIGSASENPYHHSNLSAAYLKGFYPVGKARWGINGMAPELAWLWQQQRLAWVINTGVLAEPVTRSTLKQSECPRFLFAHNHQQRALATASAMQRESLGWGGRLADHWQNSGNNPDNLLGMNICFSGKRQMMQGLTTKPLALRSGTPTVLMEMSNLKNSNQRSRRELFEALISVNHHDPLARIFNQRQQESLALSTLLSEQWPMTPSFEKLNGPYGERLFVMPTPEQLALPRKLNGVLLKQLESVVRMMDIGKRAGLKRQLFLVTMGGFDTHAGQREKHPLLLRSLSLSLWKFQLAIDAMGLSQQVVLFSQSDFGRTLQHNGDGTDHAWGGHQLVLGGPVNKGVYGNTPDMRAGSQDSYGDKRGRFIPQYAAEQTTAAMLNWFGVDTELMPAILPNLARFSARGALTDAYLPLLTA